MAKRLSQDIRNKTSRSHKTKKRLEIKRLAKLARIWHFIRDSILWRSKFLLSEIVVALLYHLDYTKNV